MSPAGLIGWRSEQLEDVKTWLAVTDDVDQAVAAQAFLLRIRPSGNTGSRSMLDMDEAIRRTERRIAELVRADQERGALSVNVRRPGDRRPSDVASRHTLSHCYALYDGVSDEQFEAALLVCRAAGSLARHRVKALLHPNPRPAGRRGIRRDYKPRAERVDEIRQLALGGHRSVQIASLLDITESYVRQLASEEGVTLPDESFGKSRANITADRVVRESLSTLEGIAMAIQLIDPADLNPEETPGWAASLKASIRTLNQLHKEMTR